ncbi:uncharacterized protein LOC129594966 isoform X3 [Paramacrobiotus metropolitanus]|nr:uncharacterized protein LOC129594966 isoform X3 [Paramacrobiotus metropolitanus]XP_055347815.1 uncharacterized protein LOC129594966 isoform X3 [Paramacrobiotus metropolitanus]
MKDPQREIKEALGTYELSYEKFLERVKETVTDEQWTAIMFGVEAECSVEEILQHLHAKYTPLSDGTWKKFNEISPRWDVMFRWTCTPLDELNSIFVLMEPLMPCKTYVSLGLASGVTAKVQGSKGALAEVPTVRKLCQIFHSITHHNASWDRRSDPVICDAECIKEMNLQFGDKFDPIELAEGGTLLLNIASTRCDKKTNSERDLWEAFGKSLLKYLDERYPNLILVQLHGRKKFNASEFYTTGSVIKLPGGNKHLSRFTKNDIQIMVRLLLELWDELAAAVLQQEVDRQDEEEAEQQRLQKKQDDWNYENKYGSDDDSAFERGYDRSDTDSSDGSDQESDQESDASSASCSDATDVSDDDDDDSGNLAMEKSEFVGQLIENQLEKIRESSPEGATFVNYHKMKEAMTFLTTATTTTIHEKRIHVCTSSADMLTPG